MKRKYLPSLRAKRSNLFLNQIASSAFGLLAMTILVGCTVKAVGDPNRPITINANVVVDIRGLKQTAAGIEDRVAQGGH